MAYGLCWSETQIVKKSHSNISKPKAMVKEPVPLLDNI